MLPSSVSPPPLGFYVHVPFCATRCGYCDFNTYTAEELGAGVSRATYADTVIEEIRWARGQVPDDRPVSTVFVGGGTPTLLGARDLVRILEAIRMEFGLEAGAEVTTEANPDSVSPAMLEELHAGGFTRVSFGVQSLAPHVLAVLERTHTPGRSLEAIAEARAAGFTRVSADLIYATPGETDADLVGSLQAVLDAGVDHLSAYSLIVEDGTRLAARVRRDELPAPDDDVAADRYRLIDTMASAAGLQWYEVSNWALRVRSAGTTWATGATPTGGGPAPVRTGTWVGGAGGISSIRRHMHVRWPRGKPRSRARRRSMPRGVRSSGSCSVCARGKGSRARVCRLRS